MQASGTNESDGMMVLPAVLDLAAAKDLLATLLQQLANAGRLNLDAAGVETLTLPCAQVILAAIRGGRQVSIANPSDAFISAFGDLGLDWSQGQAPAPQLEQAPACEQNWSEAAELSEEAAMTKRILTIDDSKTMRDMLMLALSDAGFDVLQAVDGQDGLDVLGKERVDVVITDINMPKMDGYEVIRNLRINPIHKTTPILVLTTESSAEKKGLAREAGAE